MRYITPSVLLALAALACCVYFLYRALSALQSAPVGLDWVRRTEPDRLSFAGKRHPMERKDALPVLLLTLIYALTAFFQLGDLSAPTGVYDFAQSGSVLIALEDTVYVTGLRTYSGLGTGSYNVEVSSDGEHWSTLWQRHEDESNKDKVTGYYFADAAGYSPNYALTQKYNELYKWKDLTVENPQNVRYLRITGRADKQNLQLTRFCLLGADGSPVFFRCTVSGGTDLGDLFSTEGVPDRSTWHNSTYFDEIYHARTAKEHIDNVYPYEVTHPPLGKLILGLGIRLFGMTPFGWRFSGTLLGVLMLPILYLFLKNMFGKTVVATCGTLLFATDFMHLTHTRIATIDTYAVFFILLMYFFMYRYLTLPAGASFWRGIPSLLLSGLCWGLGAACKWTVFYAGIGLALVFFMGLFQRVRDWPMTELPSDDPSRTVRLSTPGKGRWVVLTLLFAVFCFVLLPFAIYTASYLPYARALEVDLSLSNTLAGLREGLPLLFHNVLNKVTGAARAAGYQAADIPRTSLGGIMCNNQWYMLTYHQGVHQAHPYSAWWFQWIVDGRPILYYMDNEIPGYTTRFAAFANPVLCWTGLLAILVCMAHAFRRRWAKLSFLGGLGIFAAAVTWKVQHTENGVFDPALPREELTLNLVILAAALVLYLAVAFSIALLAPGHDSRGAFLLVAYLSQLVPWFFIGRTTFEYHYFPSLLFLVFAVSYLFNALVEWDRDWKLPVYSLTALSAGLYALFYPVLIGLTIPTWYEPLVKWIESWPF